MARSRSAVELARLTVAIKHLARLLDVEYQRLADGQSLGSTVTEPLESHDPAQAYKIASLALADVVKRVETLDRETRLPRARLSNEDRELLKDVAFAAFMAAIEQGTRRGASMDNTASAHGQVTASRNQPAAAQAKPEPVPFESSQPTQSMLPVPANQTQVPPASHAKWGEVMLLARKTDKPIEALMRAARLIDDNGVTVRLAVNDFVATQLADRATHQKLLRLLEQGFGEPREVKLEVTGPRRVV